MSQEETHDNRHGRRRRHILMLPYLAQGHIIPFLSLAKLILNKYPHSFTITLLSTPLNVQNLRLSLPSTTSANLLLQELPFSPTDHGLPPDGENTSTLSTDHQMLALLQASQSLKPHLEHLVVTSRPPPLCIIADVFLGWTVEVARKHGVFHTVFTTCSGLGTAGYMSLWLHLPHLSSPPSSEEFRLPGFHESFRLHRSQISKAMRNANGGDLASVLYKKLISLSLESNFMLCNSVEDVETMGMELLRKITGLPVRAIGPLLSGGTEDSKEGEITSQVCKQWLDLHPPRSVLYISFGSQSSITAANMAEMAVGLEASGKPFIWVVRPPVGFDQNEEFRPEWLPSGFEERMRGSKQGVVVKKWAPQVEVLGHGSTGGFLSHCGWNSVLESLSNGVPVIGWPMAADQFLNSKMLVEEFGVGVELGRGVDGCMGREEVERVVRMVVGGKEGEGMRRRAAEVAEKTRGALREEGEENGTSLRGLEDFVEEILKGVRHGE